MICTIYKITNKIDNKVYIGQTWRSIETRFKAHCNKNECVKLYRAISFHGKDNFYIENLVIVNTQDLADYFENFYISYYDSVNIGYNIRPGGNNSLLNEETKMKISESLTGHKVSDDSKYKMRIAKLGKKPSEEHKIKLSLSSHHAKLNHDLAKNIRKEYYETAISLKQISKKHNLSTRSMYNLLKNKSYKDKNFIIPIKK